MDAEAREALATIRRCVARDRIRLTQHFRVRLVERGVLWPDVLTAIDEPADVQAGRVDDAGRPRWIVSGEAADGSRVQLVCAIGQNQTGELTVFITAFWEDRR